MSKHTTPNEHFSRHSRVTPRPVQPGISESQSDHDIGNVPYHAARISMGHDTYRLNGHHEHDCHIASTITTRPAAQESQKALHTHFSFPQKVLITSMEISVPEDMIMEARSLDGQNIVSPYSRLATINPPITKASLSELDLKRIINDPKLRHDLNFERELAFRPDYYGQKGEQKRAMARAYWAALAHELRIYVEPGHQPLSLSGYLLSDCTDTCSFSYSSSTNRRLPQMLYTLHDVLKSLVPEAEWHSIDQTLDVDFLMQQLQKGVCDLKGLSDWLGQLLMGSCSPCRDPTVRQMVTTIQEAVTSRDAQKLVDGVEQLFVILETMKLDVANHQIRELKFLMIDDSIQFQQRYFLGMMQSGLHVEDARQWYNSTIHQEQPRNSENCLAAFARPVIDLVVESEPQFPTTFIFDFDRLRALRADFQSCMYQELCCKALDRLLHSSSHLATPPQDSYSSLLHRISAIQISLSTPNNQPVPSDEVALEIVRTALSICNNPHLPSDTDVAATRAFLDSATDAASAPYEQLQCSLCADLEDIVDEELDTIAAFSPLQILNYYHPSSTHPRSAALRGGLQDVGERLAHIVVLHWRIWAPILYLQPRLRVVLPQATREQNVLLVRRKALSAPALGALWEDGLGRGRVGGQREKSREAP
ncbi:hypothetical protein MMC13_004055 [Lambiella insularis]|nr:hypothetical protein [Lambiella insularis]